MKEIFKKIRFTICIMLCFLNMACGARWIVQGQVLDSQTADPIEGAAVWIYWSKTGSGPPGLAGSVIVEISEDLTDTQGMFQVPKYLTKNYRMAVYKKGYVCWSNEDIFPTFEKRTNFKLKNEMVIKLERLKEEYSKIRHARYTISSSIGCSSAGIFGKTIQSERDIYFERQQQKK